MMTHAPSRLRAVLIAASILTAHILTSGSDPAAGRESRRDSSRTITSCSSYGNGCLTVPVRRGRLGSEMRTRGGNWVDCRGDCRETLRQDVLDFWETQKEKALMIR